MRTFFDELINRKQQLMVSKWSRPNVYSHTKTLSINTSPRVLVAKWLSSGGGQNSSGTLSKVLYSSLDEMGVVLYYIVIFLRLFMERNVRIFVDAWWLPKKMIWVKHMKIKSYRHRIGNIFQSNFHIQLVSLIKRRQKMYSWNKSGNICIMLQHLSNQLRWH